MKQEIETALNNIRESLSDRVKKERPTLELEWVECTVNLQLMNRIILIIAEAADIDPKIIIKRISRRTKRHHSKNEFEEATQLGYDLCGEIFDKEILNINNNLL